ncbi:MAG: hypothetical protein ABIQ40_20560 [Bacteroidia bacterium]
MEVSFSKSFYRSVAKINDQKLLGKIEGVILKAKRVNQVSEKDNIKKLVGFKMLIACGSEITELV